MKLPLRIKTYLALCLAPFALQACMSNSGSDSNTATTPVSANPQVRKDNDFIQKLADLQKRNPRADATQALSSGDKRFIAKAGRGLSIPGIDVTSYAKMKDRCSLRYEDGFGDMLYGEHHRRYYGALVAYAEQYNQTIRPTCQ